jgi:hypothetical protein
MTTSAQVILLYGFFVSCTDTTEYELPDGVKSFNVNVQDHNSDCYEDTIITRYIGIPFGEMMPIFDNVMYSPNTLQMTRQKPTKEIKKRMRELFPDKKKSRTSNCTKFH